MTIYEKQYFDIIIGQLPKICKALENINTTLENINANLEKTKQDIVKYNDTECLEDKKWYDLEELLKLHLPDNTSILCLDKLNNTDSVTDFLYLKTALEPLGVIRPDIMSHYQFSILEKGDIDVK